MAKLDWERAKERDAARRKAAEANSEHALSAKRQAALAAFVEKHELCCFKCGAEKGEWAKTGISKRGPWAICMSCVGRDGEARAGADPAAPSVSEPRPRATTPAVYTDGACLGNPGRGGYAAVIVGVLPRDEIVVSGSEPYTTNNRMELRAVIEGLSALDPSPTVEIVTDSQYVLNGYTQLLPEWVRRGWRTSAKKPVKNTDLWTALVAAAQRHGLVTWRWTPGHSGDRFNEMAHRIAEQVAASN